MRSTSALETCEDQVRWTMQHDGPSCFDLRSRISLCSYVRNGSSYIRRALHCLMQILMPNLPLKALHTIFCMVCPSCMPGRFAWRKILSTCFNCCMHRMSEGEWWSGSRTENCSISLTPLNSLSLMLTTDINNVAWQLHYHHCSRSSRCKFHSCSHASYGNSIGMGVHLY